MILNNKILMYTISFFLHCAYKMCVHVRHYYISFPLMQSRDSLYTWWSSVYMYSCDRSMCFTPCLAAFISSWVALASYKDSLFTRIRTYTADALQTTDYQIRTAWQIDQSSAKSWWTTCNWNNYAIATLSSWCSLRRKLDKVEARPFTIIWSFYYLIARTSFD